jgi:hypothetical protein
VQRQHDDAADQQGYQGERPRHCEGYRDVDYGLDHARQEPRNHQVDGPGNRRLHSYAVDQRTGGFAREVAPSGFQQRFYQAGPQAIGYVGDCAGDVHHSQDSKHRLQYDCEDHEEKKNSEVGWQPQVPENLDDCLGGQRGLPAFFIA